MWFGAKLECMLGLQAVKAKLVVASFVKNLIGTAIYLKVFFYLMAVVFYLSFIYFWVKWLDSKN